MRTVVAAFATLGLLVGCDLPDPKGRSADVPVMDSSRDLTIGFGSLGPAQVGMNKREALDTGLFDKEDFDRTIKCGASALKWKKKFKSVEVRTDGAGTIRSLRIVGPGPKTLYGTQVGTTLSEIRGSYAGAMTEPSKIGPSSSGIYVRKNNAWIGFLFDEDPDEVDVLDTVNLIEVTEGSRPQLRGNC